ncbi:hypothetical protein OF83DRAFT_932470 [Amylostereum chailletii]|nr:hypothetical protein OF83DRAFT_932470 [Amylostereum chailletii]
MPASVYYPDIAQPEDQEDVHLTLCGVTAIIKTQTDDDHVAVECQNIHRSKSGRQLACEINGEADERFMIIIKNRTRPSVPLECEVHMDGRRMDEFQVLPGRDGDFEARGVLVCHHGKTQVRPFLFSRVVYGDSSTSHASTSTARDREPRVQNGYYDLGTIILKLYRTRQSIESQTPASPSADTRASHGAVSL